MYWKLNSGRRHAGLASSASWQRAAEERYDDVRELIDRDKFRFLAWGVGWGQPPFTSADFNKQRRGVVDKN